MEGERLFGHWQPQQQQQGEPSMSEMGSTLSLSEHLHNTTFLHINWDHHHSMEQQQSSHFASPLSSMVSSPSNPNPSPHTDPVVMHELIGRLGSICNSSGDISPHATGNTTSCYSTPLNSPPKLNLSTMDRRNLPISFPSSNTEFAPFSSDPRFARIPPPPETGKLSRASSSKSLMASGSAATLEEPREESSVSGAVAAGECNGRKRKANHKGNKDLPKVAGEDDGRGKKTRSLEGNGKPKGSGGGDDEDGNRKNGKDSNLKPPEPPKQDYIHVRARRGQATDSHSLAERVRREKISERMKFLQNLVPGCNKVTGKAVMLDEIINYVQSLQRQVEFLSMKLATLNPRLDVNVDGLLQKDMLSQRGPLQQLGVPVETHIPPLSYPFQQHPSNVSTLQSIMTSGMESHCAMNPIDAAIRPPFDGIGDAPPQIGTLWEDDLHSFVQMSYAQNQEIPHTSQPIPGSLPVTHMKVEL